jgi:predicted peptidase
MKLITNQRDNSSILVTLCKRAAYALLMLGCTLSLISCSGLRPVSTKRPATIPSDLNVSAKSVSWTGHANYLIFLPEKYQDDDSQRWPLILFLHGIGEGGTDVWRTATYGPIQYIKKHHDFPFIVVSPQCPAGHKWSDEANLSVLDDVIAKYPVDTNRIYLTGLSQGGFGVWSLATTYPQRFAAVAPISGGGDVMGFIVVKWNHDRIAPLQHLPVWAFHGAKDTVVPLAEDIRMVEALKKAGDKDVKLTIYPNGQHNVWDETYANPELYQWFLSHHLSTATEN